MGLSEGKTTYQVTQSGRVWNLRQVDVEIVRAEFQGKPHKNIEIADLRAFLEDKLKTMLQENSTRADFAQRLQQIVERYNAGSLSAESYFDDLMNFNQDLSDEEERHTRMGLTEEELELFDIIKKESMTQAEEIAVKNAAKGLLTRLRHEHPKIIVLDWH